MTGLLEMQRRVAKVVMQPLTRHNRMRRNSADEAGALIKPNGVLSSFERLEIYNRQYWFRILSCFSEDFPGLHTIIGARQFDGLMRAYLTACPSQSFTLRNLGSRLWEWLSNNRNWIVGWETLALDMVQLEWAHIESFDGGYEPALRPADIESDEFGGSLHLQPYIRLIELNYAVDDLLIEIHSYGHKAGASSNSARVRQLKRRVRQYEQPGQQRIYLAVHRSEESVYYKRVPPEAFRMLQALQAQCSFEASVEAAFAQSSMTEEERIAAVGQWFANWSELGWFCRSARLTSQ